MTLPIHSLVPLFAVFRAPLVALVVGGLTARLAARWVFPGAALACGWLAGGAALAWPPHGMAARLAVCGGVVLFVPWLERRAPRRLAPALPALLGAAGAWWLGGGGAGLAALVLAAAGGALGMIAARLMGQADDWARLAGCATLGPALLLLGAPDAIAALALVPAGAALGGIGASASPLALSLGLAASQFAAALALSHVREGHVDAYGIACLAPLATLWLGPLAARAAPLLAGLAAAIVALALAVGFAWVSRHAGG